MKIDIPGNGPLVIETVILDLNGTLRVGGKLVPGVETRIAELRKNAASFFFRETLVAMLPSLLAILALILQKLHRGRIRSEKLKN